MVGYVDIEDLLVSSDISLPGFAARFVFQRGTGLQFPTNSRHASSEFYIGPNFRFTNPATVYGGPITLTPTRIPVSHTPIPGAIWLLASGLVGLMGLKGLGRRKPIRQSQNPRPR